MKRCWFGLGLLILMLVGGLLVTRSMDRNYSRMSHQLAAAREAALAEEWNTVRALLEDAKDTWQARWHFSAAFSDHEPMDQIESCFAQLEVFLKMRDPVSFCGSCRYLSKQLEALGQSHSFNLQNFF